METISSIAQLQQRLCDDHLADRNIGFVPTMGALHDGHKALIGASIRNNPITVVSIFVNPLQFGEGEDFERYPRDADSDAKACRKLGVDYLFVPTATEMLDTPSPKPKEVPHLYTILEGVARPHHFVGVAAVLAKFFSIIGRCRAYFGEKDWQQVCVVRGLVRDLGLSVEVVACPTVREPDGLAMSSRNAYLSQTERAQALTLQDCLGAGLEAIQGGERLPELVESAMREHFVSSDLAKLEYVAAVQADTLTNNGPLSGEVRLLVAAKFGQTRLIDNLGTFVDRPPLASNRPPLVSNRPPLVSNWSPLTSDRPPLVSNWPPLTSKEEG